MTKKRDKEYGPKPQDVPLKHEEILQSPAKLPSSWCKKNKAEHIFELDSSIDYSERRCMETYRCAACDKKKRVLKRWSSKHD